MENSTTDKAGVPKVAYSIRELVELGPPGRTRIYEELKAGRLKAKKNGKRTIILHDDYMEYLHSLPDYEAAP